MNLYSRALRHIDMDDVKRRREDKIVKQKIVEEHSQRSEKEKKVIEQLTEQLKSDWRKDLGMEKDSK
jgi:hypothetical protein